MSNVLVKRRMDMIKVEGDQYVVAYEENTIPGALDARVISNDEKTDYRFGNGNVGKVEVIDEELAQDPDRTIEYLEEEFDPNPHNEALEDLISF